MEVLTDEQYPIQYDLDRFPLMIKMGETESQMIWLLGRVDTTTPPFPAREGARFSMAWRQEDKSIWLTFHHTGFEANNMKGHTCWTNMAWRVLKLKRKLVIYCHAASAYEIHYKDLYDSQGQQRSIKDFTKSVTHIWFSQYSTDLKIKQLGLLLEEAPYDTLIVDRTKTCTSYRIEAV